MKRVIILLIVATAYNMLGIEKGVLAQSNQSNISYRVQVDITADESLTSSIGSYIKRELRSLHDVVITDTDPTYRIGVVALTAKSKTGGVFGVTLSVTFARPVDVDTIKQTTFLYMPEAQDRETWDMFIDVMLAGCEILLSHQLLITDVTNLHQICKELVADFDNTVIESQRERSRRKLDAEKKAD